MQPKHEREHATCVRLSSSAGVPYLMMLIDCACLPVCLSVLMRLVFFKAPRCGSRLSGVPSRCRYAACGPLSQPSRPLWSVLTKLRGWTYVIFLGVNDQSVFLARGIFGGRIASSGRRGSQDSASVQSVSK